MVLWRISRFHDLSGRGARVATGRWNVAGPPMVYTSESAASALLEVCAHMVADEVPKTFQLLRIVGPSLLAEEIRLDELPPNWAESMVETQEIGASWLASQRSVLLKVPSVLVPETWNYLLNPLHPEAALFEIQRAYQYPFDMRLKG